MTLRLRSGRAPHCIAVLGPTAAGKTQAAIALGTAYDGEIVSCDSVQLYQELNIGSAKPSPEETSRVRHHLIDVFPPDFQVDVGLYKQKAEEAIEDILGRGKTPILAGGTGLYFNSLYYGLFDAPSRDGAIRDELEQRASESGIEALYAELRKCDSAAAAKILPNDKRRIVRALEVFYKTGVPVSSLREHNKKLGLRWLLIGVNTDRAALYGRIEARVDRMAANGLVKETRAILEKYGPGACALGSIGYRHAAALIRGEVTEEEFLSRLKQDTRRYAKRQLIWFRKIREIQWFESGETDQILACAGVFLDSLKRSA